MFIYYVYAYLREDGIPYYIGKGKGDRAFKKHGNTNVPNDKTRIVFLESNLSETGALALERRYIRWYGRKDNGTGILRNFTDGGEGLSGRVYTEEMRCKIRESNKRRKGFAHSSETKLKISASLKISEAHKARVVSEETRQKLSKLHRGKTRSVEARQNMKEAQQKREITTEIRCKLSGARKGKPHSAETKQKMSESHRARLAR